MTATALRGWERVEARLQGQRSPARIVSGAPECDRAAKDAYLGQTRAAVQNPSPDDPTKKRRTFLEWLFGR
jgi:hypothetical protein